MRTTFLDYYKMVLDKVSFDQALFIKEYQKALQKLHANEVGDLNGWLASRGLQRNLPYQVKNTRQVNP